MEKTIQKLVGLRMNPAIAKRVQDVADKMDEGNASRVIRRCVDAYLPILEKAAGINSSAIAVAASKAKIADKVRKPPCK